MSKPKKIEKTSWSPGAHFKREESVTYVIDMHRDARKALTRFCETVGIEIPLSNVLVLMGDDLDKIDGVLKNSTATEFPELKAWGESSAYQDYLETTDDWKSAEKTRIEEKNAKSRKKAARDYMLKKIQESEDAKAKA